jgi:Phytanoyl-CoA dioxygenase (PhyH)
MVSRLNTSAEPTIWHNALPNIPWVESPFFDQALASHQLSPEAYQVAKSLHDEGYAIIDFPECDFDQLAATIVESLHHHYDWLAWREHKIEGLRVQDAWRFNSAVKKIATNQSILDLLSAVYGRLAFPFQTLNFPVGTQQHFHTDSVHFSSIPERFMCGVWVALEDVHPEAGPLIYYPKSHKLPIYLNEHIGALPDPRSADGFGTYHLFTQAWQELVRAHNLEEKRFLPKKGQALIWCANLLHGGALHPNKSRTRYSQVSHYYFQDCAYYTPLGSLPYLGAIDYYTNLIDISTNLPVHNYVNGLKLESDLIQSLDHKSRLLSLLNASMTQQIENAIPKDFDPEAYLRLNADVAKAGVDPKAHYFNFGIQENRRYR